jgi:hypothetical protein
LFRLCFGRLADHPPVGLFQLFVDRFFFADATSIDRSDTWSLRVRSRGRADKKGGK